MCSPAAMADVNLVTHIILWCMINLPTSKTCILCKINIDPFIFDKWVLQCTPTARKKHTILLK